MHAQGIRIVNACMMFEIKIISSTATEFHESGSIREYFLALFISTGIFIYEIA